MKMTIASTLLVTAALAALPLVGCSSSYKDSGGKTSGEQYSDDVNDARDTVHQFRDKDTSIEQFFDRAVGYAVYPKVAKGGAIIGGAHGNGILFEGGSPIGRTEVAQASIGAQLGGQTYREIIFFENTGVLDHFKSGNMEFSAQASAVAVESGAAATADFDNGVAVFTMPRAGLMFEASIGGQKFSFDRR